jgi:hypothetical protein
MKAYMLTAIDLIGLGAMYWGVGWLIGQEQTLAGYIMCIAITALHGISRLKTGGK